MTYRFLKFAVPKKQLFFLKTIIFASDCFTRRVQTAVEKRLVFVESFPQNVYPLFVMYVLLIRFRIHKGRCPMIREIAV